MCGNVSDHYLITFQLRNINISSAASPPRFMRNYSKADLDGLQAYFLDYNLNDCLRLDSVDDIWTYIRNYIF